MSARPEEPARAPTGDGRQRGPDDSAPRGSAGRERLVAAGISLVDELPLSRAIVAPTAAVAQRAGVTTGSFFHHFPTAAAFAEAIVLEHLETPDDGSENLEELAASLTHIDLLEVVRSTLTDTWQVYQDDGIRQRYRVAMALWSHHRHALEHGPHGCRTVGDVLAHATCVRQDDAAHGWQVMLTATQREIVEPFDLDRLATALSALFQGLVVRHDIDPDAVDDALFADTVVALVTALTAPAGSRIRLRDLTAPLEDLGQLSPQARSGVRRRRETRDRVVAAVGDMFGAGWESVSTSQVAARAGVSAQTVVNLFGSPRGVAAATFGRFVGEIRDAGDGDGEPEPTGARAPLDGLARTLERLGGAVDADPEAARALLAERLAVGLRHRSELIDMDIRLEVPLAEAVATRLVELDLGGAEPLDVATMLINFVIAHALMRPRSHADTAELALRLLPAPRADTTTPDATPETTTPDTALTHDTTPDGGDPIRPVTTPS